MYSVIQTSGFQYKVNAGQILRLPLMQAEVGATLTFDKVLLATDGSTVQVGQPVIAGAAVSAEVVSTTSPSAADDPVSPRHRL